MQAMFSRRAALGTALALALAASAASAFPWSSRVKPPGDPAEYAAERATQAGAWRVGYRPEPGTVPVGRLHSWTLQLRKPDGTPVTDAAITVDGDMPEHGHGLPTRPRVTRHLGNGDYLVEGVKFQMGGWWVMDFDIAAEGRRDRVRFHLQLRK